MVLSRRVMALSVVAVLQCGTVPRQSCFFKIPATLIVCGPPGIFTGGTGAPTRM